MNNNESGLSGPFLEPRPRPWSFKPRPCGGKAFLGFSPREGRAEAGEAPMDRPVIHLICNAHLDPVWQWRWEEGCAEALATFRVAAALLREDPTFRFNHNEALLYRWVEEHDPGLFEEIRALVREGRWSVLGGWDLQPDVNLPGLESLYRHMEEGRRYFQDRFGVRPRVACNFDSFGHPAGLPQLLRQGGYSLYVFMRPLPEELELPDHLFRWRGLEGSEIPALRVPIGFYHSDRDDLDEKIARTVELALEKGRDVPLFWGLGDHGGGATREDLERIREWRSREKRVRIEHSTLEDYLDAVGEAIRRAPLFEGGLQRSMTGCYTSLSRLKRAAARSLGLLVQAESLRSATWWDLGLPFPEEDLAQAWRDHLFNDFHDILPGSGTEEVERDALALYGKAEHLARRARMGAAAAWSRGGREQPPSLPLSVLNGLPLFGRTPVEVEFMVDYRPLPPGEWHVRLFDSSGREVPCQEEPPLAMLPHNGWRRKISFEADLSALGARGYHLEVRKGPAPPREPFRPALSHGIDPASGLVGRIEFAGAENLLSGPLFLPLVLRDEEDSWGMGAWSYRDLLGPFEAVPGRARLLADGPVRSIREAEFRFGASRILVKIFAYRDFPALEYRMRIHWNEERRRLKLSLPSALSGARLLAQVPGGAVEIPPGGGEWPQGRWFLLEGKAGGREAALGVAHLGLHGLDFEEGEARVSVLRSAAYCHERGFPLEGISPLFMDQGVHRIRLVVTAGDPEEVRRRLPRMTALLESPPFCLAHLPGPSEPREIFSLEPENLALLSLRPAPEGKALLARIQEGAGLETEGVLALPSSGSKRAVRFRPFQVRTLRIFAGEGPREIPPA